MNAITRAWATIKAATSSLTIRFSRSAGWGSRWGVTWLTRTRLDISGRVGDGSNNSAVAACISWICRTWPEAPMVVQQINSDGEWETVKDHPLAARLRRPNPFYSGRQLLTATLADRRVTGNAYWLKVRNGASGIAELWWLPSSMVEPCWPDNDSTVFISHYEYTVDGVVTKYDPGDIVHFRIGFDPVNMRKGKSELSSILGEVFTDEEASSYVATVLSNMGVPGVVISPEGDANPSDADLEEVKAKFQQKFGGDRRGEPLVMKGPTKVSVLSFSPEQMKVRELRRIPEERITAALGIPAIVVGLGAGLDRSTFANMAEAREAAYEGHIIPDQALFDDDLNLQLIPDFGVPERLQVSHDYSEVRVLQQDENELHTRAREDLKAGLLTLNQALTMIGEQPVDGSAGDARYVPKIVTVTLPDDLGVPPAPALPVPTPLRALPAPTDVVDETAKARRAREVKAETLSQDDLLWRYEAGLETLSMSLETELMDAFEEIAETAAGRAASALKGGHLGVEVKADTIDGLVTEADHEPIRRLLRGYVLRSMRQAAQDLAPLTGDTPVRITRNMPAVKAAIADMESRMAGIVETTDADFGRLIARMERRPGSVSLAEIQDALQSYVAESYPGRVAAIARTEFGYAHGRGVLLVAEKSGLADRVHVHDGDGDAACRERNGTTATLEEAASIGLLHTNCRLRLIPIVEAAA